MAGYYSGLYDNVDLSECKALTVFHPDNHNPDEGAYDEDYYEDGGNPDENYDDGAYDETDDEVYPNSIDDAAPSSTTSTPETSLPTTTTSGTTTTRSTLPAPTPLATSAETTEEDGGGSTTTTFIIPPSGRPEHQRRAPVLPSVSEPEATIDAGSNSVKSSMIVLSIVLPLVLLN